MPSFLLPDALAVLPLRAVIFQCLLLLVAISLEAIVLRNQLRLGFQPSIRYAAVLNLLAVVLGWLLFFAFEPLLPSGVRVQLLSYILFGNFLGDMATNRIGIFIVIMGLVSFFLTFWVKAKGLEILTWILGSPIVPQVIEKDGNRFRYRRSPTLDVPTSRHILAVLQANALSFSAILLLLILRYRLG